jgi:hypothetical protein
LARSRLADVCISQSLLDDYKDCGVNCDKLASEIEDHILELHWGCGNLEYLVGGRKGSGDSLLLCPESELLRSVRLLSFTTASVVLLLTVPRQPHQVGSWIHLVEGEAQGG